jgi:DNA invertase Pin-like site-specific DNA recombinase
VDHEPSSCRRNPQSFPPKSLYSQPTDIRLGRPPVSQKAKEEIIEMRATGLSMNKIARGVGVSKTVVVRTING